MTRLFLRFYLGVLIVLFLTWFIYGKVSKQRAEADLARVVEEAHGGGARLVAQEINAVLPSNRNSVLARLRGRFDYPVKVVGRLELPGGLQRKLARGADVACFRPSPDSISIVATLAMGTEVVQLGPFPNLDLTEIETAIGSWMRLAADQLDDSQSGQRSAVVQKLQAKFDYPVELAKLKELPDWPRDRITRGEDITFYSATDDRWFAATPLADGETILRFGPFPSFKNIEQNAATTTVALVLLPAALAIAVMLRPVAQQLRRVEHAAKVIAAGDLSARVDERRMKSAKPLSQAFNLMAGRTETLVRTQRELLQAVSHELRTPLSRIRFAIDLIESAADRDERQRRLESLEAAADELDELVGELISYVRLETTVSQLNREHIDAMDIADILIAKQASLFPTIRFDTSERKDGEERYVYADRTGLQRVLNNLLSNAGRFAKSCVTIRLNTTEEGTVIDVDDDGAGIPASERDRVLEPFVRLDNNSNGHGVGLGLALVQRVVAQHGGTVSVLTSPSDGCRIRTVWPAEPAAMNHDQEVN